MKYVFRLTPLNLNKPKFHFNADVEKKYEYFWKTYQQYDIENAKHAISFNESFISC